MKLNAGCHLSLAAIAGIPLDATQPEPRVNRIAIAYDRDATNVALATQFGLLTLTEMKVWVQASESGNVKS